MVQQQSKSSVKDATLETSSTAHGGKFSLTGSAAERIKSMLVDEPDGSFFRVAVLGGGCSGFQYDFSIDGEKQADDCVFVSHGVEVVIDAIYPGRF